MSAFPTPDELRATVGAFDPIRKRIFASLIVEMIGNSERVREREWISEKFARTAALALELETEADSGPAAVAAVQEYARENMTPVLDAAYGVFQAVARTMSERSGGFSFDDAVEEALSYVASGDDAEAEPDS